MLLHLLARPVPFYAALTTEIEMAVLCQVHDSSGNMVSHGRLGVRSGTTIQWTFRRARGYSWDTVLLELVERVKQCAGHICYFICQYPRFHCEILFFFVS